MEQPTHDTVERTAVAHRVDHISLGKIVQIREKLLIAQAAGRVVFRFESGDPNFAPAPHVIDAILAAAFAGKTHYVPNNGIPELRTALAEKVKRRNRIPGVTDADIFVTNGAMHALFATFQSLLAPGDEVIIPDPMWTEVAENIRLAGGRPVGVPLEAAHNYAYRPEDIERAITPNTRAIFVNTPHNPTGAVASRDALREIVEVARRHDLWVVSDEAYEDLTFAPHEHHSIGEFAGDFADRVVTVFSMSKSHAMSGLRLGYIVARHPILRSRLPKVLRCTINGVNSLAQWGALAAVTGGDTYLDTMRASYRLRRDVMVDALQGIPGLRLFVPQGTFFLWAEIDPSLYQRLEVRDADALSAQLAADGIGSTPGDAFGATCDDAIRFSFSCDPSMVRAGSAALRAALA